MKKFLKGFLLFALLGILGYWAYKYYNKTASLVDRIHEDAESVIKVDLHQIKETLVWDALSSPGYYYDHSKRDTDKEKTKDSTADKGVDLQPYTAVFFTVKDVENIVFTTLDIQNSVAFETYIAKEIAKKKGTIQKDRDGLYRYAIVEKNKVAFAWNKEQLVIGLALSLEHKKVAAVFKDILIEERLIRDKSHPLITTLSKADDHITYVRKEDQIGINFEDGMATIEGNLVSKTPNSFLPEIAVQRVPNASFQIHWDYNFEQEKHKTTFIKNLEKLSFFEKNNLDVEMIANRTNGFFSLAVKGRTMQTDTVITYTYDDNFEKIAQKSTQEKEVPKIHINLGAENESLKEYLIDRDAVEQDVFKAFPYYNFYVKEGTLNTSFDTFKANMPTKKLVTSNFFDCKIDFKRLQEDLNIPQTKALFQLLDSSRFRAYQSEGNQIVLKGNFKGLKEDINILSQLFFGLQEVSKDSILSLK